jgi:hypothetical protein
MGEKCITRGTMRWACAHLSVSVGSACLCILLCEDPPLLPVGNLESSSQYRPPHSFIMLCEAFMESTPTRSYDITYLALG